MCFDTDALPPDPARTGMLAGSERTVLAADDGNRFAATVARTVEPASAGVVIIPDVRGLHRYYERLAEHTADAGVHAIAIDPTVAPRARSIGRRASTTNPIARRPGTKRSGLTFAPRRKRSGKSGPRAWSRWASASGAATP
jgi:dienelactone hydrolase